MPDLPDPPDRQGLQDAASGRPSGGPDQEPPEPRPERVDLAQVERRVLEAQGAASASADRAEEAAADATEAAEQAQGRVDPDPTYGTPGPPLHPGPYLVGLVGGLGVATAAWLAFQALQIGGVLVLVVVSLFLAVGLDPLVALLGRHGVRRSYAVVLVITGVLAALVLFGVAVVPVITDQVSALVGNVPGFVQNLQENALVKQLDQRYDILDRLGTYVTSGSLTQQVFGGALSIGVRVLSVLGNVFIVIVLTLYFLASLPTIKSAAYGLAPASRRGRVTLLGDRILDNVGGYVSGAFVVALAAGLSSLVFLVVVGLGQYAVALAVVVAVLDVIPMIGATLGAFVVCAIGFATDVRTGVLCVIFYIVYQQIENYGIYPRVMSRSVDIPGAVIVIAALVGAGLLGVIGALLAIPTAAAALLLIREILIPRQDAR